MPLRQALPLPRALIPHVQDFAEVTFPHLAPVCAAAKGDALLLLTRHADVFAERLPRDPATRVLLPLLARAADEGLSLCMLPVCCAHGTSCPWNAAMQASALQISDNWQAFVYSPAASLAESVCWPLSSIAFNPC